MVGQNSSIGDSKNNSHYFNHFDLDNIRVTANGLSLLDSETSFVDKFSTLYMRVVDALKSKSHSISYKEFREGLSIIAVDCKNSDTNSIIQLERRGHLEVNMRFSNPLPDAINIIIIGTTVGSVEIDSERRVSTHYNY